MALLLSFREAQLLDNLQDAINRYDFFNAYQMYRFLTLNYMSMGNFEDLLDYLYDGILYMIKYKQQEFAAEMAVLLITAFRISNTLPTEIWRYKLCDMYVQLTVSSYSRDIFLLHLMDLLSGDELYINASLHQDLAYLFYQKENFVEARKHFLFARSGSWYGMNLVEIHTRYGKENEVDTFLVRAVFQLLCFGDHESALDTFTCFADNHPLLRPFDIPFDYPILNFVWFLLASISGENEELYCTLCTLYEDAISVDPYFEADLQVIRQVFFGDIMAPPPIGSKVYFFTMFDHLDISDGGKDGVNLIIVKQGYRECVM